MNYYCNLFSGISNAYLSQLENNKVKKPSPHFLHKLASLYDVPYDLLMEYAGYIKRGAESTGPRTLAAAALQSQAQLSKAGAALYPNLGILDCGFSIVRDGEQHAFHASRRAPLELPAPRRGARRTADRTAGRARALAR